MATTPPTTVSRGSYYKPGASGRDWPIVPASTALLLIDIQAYNCSRAGALGSTKLDEQYWWRQLAATEPLWEQLVSTCRETGIEVIYTVIQSLTRNGRDRGLDYKISGFHVQPGSLDAEVLDCIRPQEDELVLPKTSSSVFSSTTLDYILRNLGVSRLLIAGCVTDQCVEHAIRDASDLGYMVTQITDCCVTYSQERQAASQGAISGYCQQLLCRDACSELKS